MPDLKMTNEEKLRKIMEAPDLYAYDSAQLSIDDHRSMFIDQTQFMGQILEQNDLINQVLKEEIATTFKEVSDSSINEGRVFAMADRLFSSPEPLEKHFEEAEEQLKDAFEVKTDGLGETLRKHYETIKEIKRRRFKDYQKDYDEMAKKIEEHPFNSAERDRLEGVLQRKYGANLGNFTPHQEDRQEFNAAVKGFMDAYRKITIISIDDYMEKTFKNDVSVPWVDFDKVLFDTGMEFYSNHLEKLGLWKLTTTYIPKFGFSILNYLRGVKDKGKKMLDDNPYKYWREKEFIDYALRSGKKKDEDKKGEDE